MKSPLRALILTEAGGRRGLGHLSRCSALCEALQAHRVQTSLLVDLPQDSALVSHDSNWTARSWLSTPPNSNELSSYDIVIIDSYLADVKLYESIALQVPCLASFDDTRRIQYPAGAIINPCISARRNLYDGYDGALFIGAEYTPLRRPFWRSASPAPAEHVSKVLVTVGGGEQSDLGLRIASSLAQRFPHLQLKLLSGAATAQAVGAPNIEVQYGLDAEGVCAAMNWCDVAISAGGQTLHELGAVGVPTIIFAIADNQLPNVTAWQKSGAFLKVEGSTADAIAAQLPAALDQLASAHERHLRSERARSIVDGRGALRLASAIIDRVTRRSISIRLARKEDCIAIFNISNHSSVREHSFSSQPIDFQNHQNWFNTTLQNPAILFLVATNGEDVVGQLRIQSLPTCVGIVNISVSPDHRDSKIGNSLLQAAFDFCRSCFPDMRELHAYVQKKNLKSIAFFERAGFGCPRECETHGAASVEYRYSLQRGES
jgi:UDP-2,4-diacetamido-2,4,6-trideoxy-beta-L-altropyranose hydrolase